MPVDVILYSPAYHSSPGKTIDYETGKELARFPETIHETIDGIHTLLIGM
ncbi:hypothetical protein [Sulfurovum mangrovi]|nr:hypothetical protein [Sulfurovum mangrovi]UFH58648.1 hypothetical protein LN246_09830 [Sulfurovum mangrovi]